MDISPINMKRIYQSIIEQFITLIKDGKLKPGDKLPSERTLADMFNVSRASIREAFSAMDIIGLIEVRPGEGTFVTDLNIAPFINTIAPLFVKDEGMENDLLDLRKMLEIEAVRKAAEKCVAVGPQILDGAIKRMKDAIDRDDSGLGAEADIQFHKGIFTITQSFVLIKAAECISYILETSVKFNRAIILQDKQNSEELYKQHVSIYEAIKMGDPGLAVDRMDRHLSFVRKITRQK